MRRTVLAAGLAAVLTITTAAVGYAAPVVPLPPVEGFPTDTAPSVTARSWILYDASNAVVLGSRDADVEAAMASTTKIMTALVALRSADPASIVTVSRSATDAGEAEIGLLPGEQLPLGLLVEAALIRSANDAALAVAEAVGGSEAGFVEMMNAEAARLGLSHTRFANPHGLDAPDHWSSARDLLTMTLAAMEIPEFAAAVRASQLAFPTAPDGTARVARTTNRLLAEYEGAIGVKTGFTSRAGLVLVAAAEREGRVLYAVVMGSEGEAAHFKDATALLDYGFDSFGIVPLVVSGRPYALRRSGQVADSLSAVATVEAFVYLASAGLLMPELTLAGSEPVVVISDDLPVVELAQPERPPLPGVAEAFAWIGKLWEDLVGAP